MRTLPSRLKSTAALLVATAALAGCNSMSEQECLATDWRTVGYEDGVNGYTGDRIARYRNACSEHGVTPNLSEYQSGREQGLREFCQPANGFRVGARGASYGGVCPSDLDGSFVDAYQTGRQLYVLRSRVGSAQGELYSMRAELDQIDRDLVSTAAQIVDPALTTEARAQLVIDTKQMAERKGEIKTRIPQLESELAAYQRDLDDYRASLSYIE
ncbi:MAG TPA: DUF2799 domain-containing protein [Steroidobacteraceae bacterium]|nr:DUF2799 domain-containing protein [Steroidobacteraceae bacterium]